MCCRRAGPQRLHYRLHRQSHNECTNDLRKIGNGRLRPIRNTSFFALTGALADVLIPRKVIRYVPITQRTVTSVPFALANIDQSTATAVVSRSRKIQERARPKARDAVRVKAKDVGKVKEEDVEDGSSSDHRLRCDGMQLTAMPKVTSQKVRIQILGESTMIAITRIPVKFNIIRLPFVEVTS